MDVSITQKNGVFTILDDKERTLLKRKGDNIALARFSDLDEKLKKYLAELYAELTGEDIEEAKMFLNYNTEKNEFCS